MSKYDLNALAKVFTLVILVIVLAILVLRNGESFELFKMIVWGVICYFFGEEKGKETLSTRCEHCGSKSAFGSLE